MLQARNKPRKIEEIDLRVDALDGSRLEVSYEGAAPEFIGADVSVLGDISFPLDMGPVGYATSVSRMEEATVGFTVSEEVSTTTGILWAGMGDLPKGAEPTNQQHIDGLWREEKYVQASWVGTRWSVRAHTYRGSPKELLDRLARLRFEETNDGVQVTAPGKSSLTLGNDLEARLRVPGIGWIEIFKPTQAQLSHRGTSIPGGELYEILPREMYEIHGPGTKSSIHFLEPAGSIDDHDENVQRTLQSFKAVWL